MTAKHLLLATAATLSLGACVGPDGARPLGASLDEGGFGNPTMNNVMIQTGQKQAVVNLQHRFAAEVEDTVNFAFNSAQLDSRARAILDQQANFIRQFPELKFSVFGHTDAVGTDGYNRGLGKRRANAVVNYLAQRGISRSRLEALVSYGETQPVVVTEGREPKNRRTVTEVSGFLKDHPIHLNGKYAEVVYREYLESGKRKSDISTGDTAAGAPATDGE